MQLEHSCCEVMTSARMDQLAGPCICVADVGLMQSFGAGTSMRAHADNADAWDCGSAAEVDVVHKSRCIFSIIFLNLRCLTPEWPG